MGSSDFKSSRQTMYLAVPTRLANKANLGGFRCVQSNVPPLRHTLLDVPRGWCSMPPANYKFGYHALFAKMVVQASTHSRKLLNSNHPPSSSGSDACAIPDHAASRDHRRWCFEPKPQTAVPKHASVGSKMLSYTTCSLPKLLGYLPAPPSSE